MMKIISRFTVEVENGCLIMLICSRSEKHTGFPFRFSNYEYIRACRNKIGVYGFISIYILCFTIEKRVFRRGAYGYGHHTVTVAAKHI